MPSPHELAELIAHVDCGDDPARVDAFRTSCEGLETSVSAALARSVDPVAIWEKALESDLTPPGMAACILATMFPATFPPKGETAPHIGERTDCYLLLLKLHRETKRLYDLLPLAKARVDQIVASRNRVKP